MPALPFLSGTGAQSSYALASNPFVIGLALMVGLVVVAAMLLMRWRQRETVIDDSDEFNNNPDAQQSFLTGHFSDMMFGDSVTQPVQPGAHSHPHVKKLGMPWSKQSTCTSDVTSVSSKGSLAASHEYLGRMNFRVGLDAKGENLRVHIIECVDLPPADMNGLADPYVKVFLLPDKTVVKQTKVLKKTLNPKFDQVLVIPLQGGAGRRMEDMTMTMQVMDHDRFSRDDAIGEIILPMKTVKVENSPVYWKHLQKPTVHKQPVGELMLSLCYLPSANKITVVVIKAKELPQKDMLGTSDPYVKLAMYQGNQKIEKRKTSVKPQCLTPVYNESFAFTAPPKEKLQTEVNLVLTVLDYDIISSNEEIGQCVVGPMAGDMGQKHWREMLNNPEHPTAMWHKLVPKMKAGE